MWFCPVQDQLAEDSSSRDSPALSLFALVVVVFVLTFNHHHPYNLLWCRRHLIGRSGWLLVFQGSRRTWCCLCYLLGRTCKSLGASRQALKDLHQLSLTGGSARSGFC